MGQALSCGAADEHGLFAAVQRGDSDAVAAALLKDSSLIRRTTVYHRHSLLHIAAANGQIEMLSILLERCVNVDVLNRYKQTPLMLAAMHGKLSCLDKLIEAGANILMFEGVNGRTCLHYAAYYGHSDCLLALLAAAQTSSVSSSWGFPRFVNVRDRKGATPLHLAARQRRARCVHILLDSGGLVCASTHGYGYGLSNSTPLHMAAKGGCLDCVRELLAWGADRRQQDASGRIPYAIALRHRNGACAALLNPSSSEPLVWPSPLKFMTELNQEAKALLEKALMEANREREKAIFKKTSYSMPSPSPSDDNMSEWFLTSQANDADLCCICFDQTCTIEVGGCGHRMCAQCTLAVCCHNKPKPASYPEPVCPFCRRTIVRIAVAEPRNSWNSFSEGSSNSSFKGLSAATAASFRRMPSGGSDDIIDIEK
ncbi:putative E3 ubiquitin-protein ligase XBAT31 isoform X2 [Andrographis paniculata]|uniref:putative E3 ubiquitin-protein ligase XBAT31 isoform X2 n=1 Tax=Andrographis paniculata TaxID=175694 RepID=UPI0021E925F2|nr:putative E3 ubiquitin-protein ligase XBAT31 isoform X2 [Andrographis paniculata]